MARESLAAEYREFIDGFADPVTVRFPTSLEEINREAKARSVPPEMMRAMEEFREKRGLNTEQINALLDETGYAGIIDDIAAVGVVSSETLDQLYCGEFPFADLNAQARPTRSGSGYLCLVNQGLRRFLWNLSRASTRGADASGNFPSTRTKPGSAARAEKALLLGGIFINYLYGIDRFDWTGWSQSVEGLEMTGGLSSSMRLFVVCHEVAHVHLGHVKNAPSYVLETPVGNVKVLEKSLEQEFEADALAQALLIRIARQDRAVGPVCGGVCFLMVEKIYSGLKSRLGIGRDSTPSKHPPSEVRIVQLMKILKQYGSSIELKFAEQAKQVFDEVEEIMDSMKVGIENQKIVVEFSSQEISEGMNKYLENRKSD